MWVLIAKPFEPNWISHEHAHRCRLIAVNAVSFPIDYQEFDTSLPENPVYSVVGHLRSNGPNLCHLIFSFVVISYESFSRNKMGFASDLFLFFRHHRRNHDLLNNKTFSCSSESSVFAHLQQESFLLIVLLCHRASCIFVHAAATITKLRYI